MKRVVLQIGRLMSVRLLAIGLTLGQTIVMTRVFGGEAFGHLSFALSISALLVLLLSLGLDQVLMRDIASYGLNRLTVTSHWKHIWLLIWRLVVPATCATAVVGAALFASTSLGGGYKVALIGVLVMLPIAMARKYVESIALGTKTVVRSIVGSQIAYPALMIIGGLLLWVAGERASEASVTWTYVGASIGSLLVSLVLIWPALQSISITVVEPAPDLAAQRSPVLLTSGCHFAMVSLGFVLGQHIDVLLTGLLAEPYDVSLVRIASRVAEMAGLVRAIVLLQYKPLMAEAHARRDRDRLQAHAALMVRIFALTGLPITLGLWIFANETMSVFGPEFVAGAWAMRIYVLGVFFVLMCGPCNSMLAMCGNEKSASAVIWLALAMNIVLDFLLIPTLGAVGCAIANMTSMLIVGTLSAWIVFQRLGINTTVFVLFTKAN